VNTAPDVKGSAPRPGWGPSGRYRSVPIVVGLGAFQVVGTYFASQGQPGRRPVDAIALALLASGPLALLAAGPPALLTRRRHPVPVLLVTLAATVLYLALGYGYGPAWLALIVAIVGAVQAGRRLAAWLAAPASLLVYLLLVRLLDRVPPPTPVGVAAHAGWLLVVLSLAEGIRVRRERAAEVARGRQEEARRRASEQRLRVARELHDVLAHNISLINVQAGVALHLIDERPEQARTALTAIKQASKDALGELRSVLDVLRQVDEAPPRQPAPTLARLGELVAGAKAAGLRVRARVEGEPRPLPAPVDLAGYRILQEALTNVTRHAGPASATVRVAYGERDLTVQVDDDGRGPAGAAPAGGGTGNGIRGMRERAAALGGQLEAGPRPEGGFRVLARLPLDGGDG
jgi:signal transduction histidine kinase